MDIQIVVPILFTAALGFISWCGKSVINNFEKTQEEMKSFLTNMQNFVTTTSKDLGTLTKQVEVNTSDIRTINQTIKTICESNGEMLATIKDVQNKIAQETAVQGEKIERLEKDIEELKLRVSKVEGRSVV